MPVNRNKYRAVKKPYFVTDAEFSIGRLKLVATELKTERDKLMYGAGRVFLDGLGMQHRPAMAVVTGKNNTITGQLISTDEHASEWLEQRGCPLETRTALINAALAWSGLNG